MNRKDCKIKKKILFSAHRVHYVSCMDLTRTATIFLFTDFCKGNGECVLRSTKLIFRYNQGQFSTLNSYMYIQISIPSKFFYLERLLWGEVLLKTHHAVWNSLCNNSLNL